MTDEERTALQEKIAASPGLQRFEQRLKEKLLSAEESRPYGFDPFTLLLIISVLFQAVQICLNWRTPADLYLDGKNIGMIPARRTLLVRRRLNNLWRDYCKQRGTKPGKHNPFLAAVLAAAKETTDEEMAAIIEASKKE